jgi:hypothetical protein
VGANSSQLYFFMRIGFCIVGSLLGIRRLINGKIAAGVGDLAGGKIIGGCPEFIPIWAAGMRTRTGILTTLKK